jgi:hypothetical protein
LAAEGLSCLLKSRDESSHLSGIKVALSTPAVNHLLFADDSLLLFKANKECAEEVNKVLQIYCDASGQRVNMDKSSIHFGKGCSNQIREDIKNILGVQNKVLSEKYLGMPTDVRNSSNGAFKYLKDRVWKRVQGWIEKSLSSGGKEVLIKAVAQVILTYSMACFRLPRGLCQHIDGLLRSFWWGSKEGKRRACWAAWEEMTKLKYLGGLGFRDIEMFNLALLARQAWRLLQELTSLSARVLKAAYYPDGDFLNANLGSSPSRVWRAIMDGKNVLEQGIIKRVGTGESINIWKTNWLPRDDLFKPVCGKLANPPQYVSELINANGQWDLQLLWEIFIPMDMEVITAFRYALENMRIVGHGAMREKRFSQLDQLTGC